MDYQLKPDDVDQIRRQNTLFRDALKRLSEWGEIVASLPARIGLLESAVRESSEDEANAIKELTGRVKRLEELELLRQVGAGQSPKANDLRGDIQDEHNIEHLQDMLVTTTRNLQRAELRKARLGGELDNKLENEIDGYKAAIEEIRIELNALRALKKSS